MSASYHFHRKPAPRRAVITGVGAVSAAGVGVPALWQSLLEGRSGISRITRFDTEGMASVLAGEVKNFDPLKLIEPRLKPKRLSRQAKFAVVATGEAVRDAKLDTPTLRQKRLGIILGSAICNLEEVVESARQVERRGAQNANATMIPLANMQAEAIALADLLGVDNAETMCVSTSCVSGTDAVKLGLDLIRSGRFGTIICGGTDAPTSITPMAEFSTAGLSSRRNEEPERASRPFDRERDSGLIAEGAGIVVLESLEDAEDRGAAIYAEVLGGHACLDPAKNRPGSGLETTMRTAMANASVSPEHIDYISAWGAGHPVLDRYETEAIKNVFGGHAHQIAVSSIKGVIGNPLGAAGALQVVALCLGYRQSLLPPTANLEHPDMDCDLDFIKDRPRRLRLRNSLINAHGLGGGNTSLVIGPHHRRNGS